MANLNLDRETLATFLPNHEAIKAFEKLFTQAFETNPNALLDLLGVVGSGRKENAKLQEFTKRIEELEIAVAQKQNLSELVLRIESLESAVSRNSNTQAILNRVEELENAQPKKENLIDVKNRLEKLETFLGV